jgi:hypothetical protein
MQTVAGQCRHLQGLRTHSSGQASMQGRVRTTQSVYSAIGAGKVVVRACVCGGGGGMHPALCRVRHTLT